MRDPTTPPRAVILAAGMGSRLRPLTLERPKPLVEVHGTPILHNALRHLAAAGVTQATIVVGYRGEVIQGSCGSEFSGIRISYVQSSRYETTGSAYSLWLARDALLAGDTLLLEGDVFFEREILMRMLATRHEDVCAVAPLTAQISGSAVTLAQSGLVRQILMNQTAADQRDEPLLKTMNLYRFSAATLRHTLVPALDETIVRGEVRSYVEQVLSRLFEQRRLTLGAVVCADLNWFEIDDQNDLRIAERIFAPPPARAIPALQPLPAGA